MTSQQARRFCRLIGLMLPWVIIGGLLAGLVVGCGPGSKATAEVETGGVVALEDTEIDGVRYKVIRHKRARTCFVSARYVCAADSLLGAGVSIIQVDPGVCESYDT